MESSPPITQAFATHCNRAPCLGGKRRRVIHYPMTDFGVGFRRNTDRLSSGTLIAITGINNEAERFRQFQTSPLRSVPCTIYCSANAVDGGVNRSSYANRRDCL